MANHYNSYKKFKKDIIIKYKEKKKKLSKKTSKKTSKKSSKKLSKKTSKKSSKKLSKKLRRTISNQQMDKFISINEFLAEEMSKGPEEDKGTIDYYYQSYVNVFNYFTILVNYYGFKEILCIPKFVLKFKNYISLNSIVYYTDTKELIIPAKLKEKIKNCSNADVRFIYCTFMIDSLKNKGITHANILIIDLYKKTIERFEPYGQLSRILESEINLTIEERLMKIIDLKDYEYLSPFDISPLRGLQTKADAYGGMCVSFCMLYLQLRLMNPDTIQKELIDYLLTKNKNELITLILKYAKFVELTLKKYHRLIYKNDKYIQKKWNSVQKFIISGEKEDKYSEYSFSKLLNKTF
jgi:hypothetical protein